MSETPINSAGDLRAAFADLIRRYVRHLDWDAPTEIAFVRIEASGPGLSVTYAEQTGSPPRLMISIGEWNHELPTG